MRLHNQKDPLIAASALFQLPKLPRDVDGPVFAEAWQAQAFALAVHLQENGYFPLSEWTAALGAELRRAEEQGKPDDGSHYYEHWVAALEGLIIANGWADPLSLQARKDDWARAYRTTPHGQPVELKTKP